MKPISSLDYIPEGVALAVGIVDGVIASNDPAGSVTHHRTYYRGAVAVAGFLLERRGTPASVDAGMGMMVASAALAANAIPYKLNAAAGTGSYFPHTAPAQSHPGHERPSAAGAVAAYQTHKVRDQPIPGVYASGAPPTMRPTIAG